MNSDNRSRAIFGLFYRTTQYTHEAKPYMLILPYIPYLSLQIRAYESICTINDDDVCGTRATVLHVSYNNNSYHAPVNIATLVAP